MKHIIENKEYDVLIVRKMNNNTYIRIVDSNTINVSTGYMMSKNSIKDLLIKHEKKLIKMLNNTVKKEIDSSRFYYLGSIYDIITVPTIDKIECLDDKIYIKNTIMLDKWINKKIKDIFKERYDIIYNSYVEDIPYYKLSFRKMKTRWGVCNRRSKKITLNTNLIKYRVEIIDYVIIHELAHLVHFNHSKDFWSLVSKYCPDYKKIRKELKE